MVTDKIRETKITEGSRVGAILARAMTMGRVGFSGGVDEVGVDMVGDGVMRGMITTIIGGGRRVDIKMAGGMLLRLRSLGPRVPYCDWTIYRRCLFRSCWIRRGKSGWKMPVEC
jgi:hypothetical protein